MKDNHEHDAVQIDERALDAVQGGLLLPAVQKIREAAARMTVATEQSTHTLTRGR